MTNPGLPPATQHHPAALIVRRSVVREDDALRAGRRGARKVVVIERYANSERPATDTEWRPPDRGEQCPVWESDSFELAFFTHEASQDRHHHLRGTEIYTVLEGEMSIEIETRVFRVCAGDSIIVRPGAVHRVLRDRSSFLCQVVTANCGGAGDKYVDPSAS